MDVRVDRPIKRGLLLWLSGADVRTLEKCPEERAKFRGVGGVILTTAVVAAASCFFALTAGFSAPLTAAGPVALLWGLAIMNLDRWLVSATPRRKRWFQNLAVVLPRLVLALVIGIVISTPLVLWIFQREVTAELEAGRQERVAAFQQQLDQDPRYRDVPALTAEVGQLQTVVDGTTIPPGAESPEIAGLRTEYESLDRQYRQAQNPAAAEDLRRQRDAIRASLDTAIANAGRAYQDSLLKARAAAADRLAVVQAKLEGRRADRAAAEAAFAADTSPDHGLLARLDALRQLAGDNGTLKTAYLAILFVIAAIEVLPVLVKFLMSLGPPSLYDQILAHGTQTRLAAATAAFEFERSLAKTEYDRRLAELDATTHRVGRWRESELKAVAELAGRADDSFDAWNAQARRRPSVPVPDEFAPWPDEEVAPTGVGFEETGEVTSGHRWTYDR